jgi:hypothetical protein
MMEEKTAPKITDEVDIKMITDEVDIESNNKTGCCNCFLNLLDRALFGPYVRALLNHVEDPETVSGGILSVSGTTGVLSALILSMTFGELYSASTPTTNLEQWYVVASYLATFFAMWSCVLSCCAMIVISVTPPERIIRVAKKTLYVITFPTVQMTIALFMVCVEIWLSAEVKYSAHGYILWGTRLLMIITMIGPTAIIVVMLFFPWIIEEKLGILHLDRRS